MKTVCAPHQNWKPGVLVDSPVSEMISLNPASIDTKARYKLLTGTIVPRPIAFITTLSANGTVNGAPFSFFNGVSSNPPALMFSIGFTSEGKKKDTLRNIEQNKEFVVNTVGEWMVAPMDHCSAEYPYGVSEVEQAGLTTIPSVVVTPPRIKESPVHFECRLLSLQQVGREEVGAATVVIGEIVQFHIAKQAWRDDRVISGELKSIGRIGGQQYCCIEGAFELPRPSLGAFASDTAPPGRRKP